MLCNSCNCAGTIFIVYSFRLDLNAQAHSTLKGSPSKPTSTLGETSRHTGQLPPASSWAVLSQSSWRSSGAHDNSVEARWSHLRDAIYNSATCAYGKKVRKHTDWYEGNLDEIESVTKAKRKAVVTYKAALSPRNRDALRTARNKTKQSARSCANKY